MKSKPLYIASALLIVIAALFYSYDKIMLMQLSLSSSFVTVLFAVICDIYEENNML